MSGSCSPFKRAHVAMTYEEANKELDDAGKALDEARYRLREALLPYQRAFPQALPIVEGSEEDLRLEGLREDVNNAVKRYSDARAGLRIAEQPSDWWLVLTGVLLAGGALTFVQFVILASLSCEGDDLSEDYCYAALIYIFLAAVGIPLMIAGGLLALFTIATFARFRRVMIGLGATIPAGLATFILIVAFVDGFGGDEEDGAQLAVAIAIASAAAAGFLITRPWRERWW